MNNMQNQNKIRTTPLYIATGLLFLAFSISAPEKDFIGINNMPENLVYLYQTAFFSLFLAFEFIGLYDLFGGRYQ